jgi:hypothetical protein
MVWSMMINYIFLAISSSAEHRIIYQLQLIIFSCRISFVEVELNLHGLEEKENKHFLATRCKYYVTFDLVTRVFQF